MCSVIKGGIRITTVSTVMNNLVHSVSLSHSLNFKVLRRSIHWPVFDHVPIPSYLGNKREVVHSYKF